MSFVCNWAAVTKQFPLWINEVYPSLKNCAYHIGIEFKKFCHVINHGLFPVFFAQILPALCILIHHIDVSVSTQHFSSPLLSASSCFVAPINSVISSSTEELPVKWWVLLSCTETFKVFFVCFSHPDLGRHSLGFVLFDRRREWTNTNGHRLWHRPASGTPAQQPGGQSSGMTERSNH